MSRTVVASFKDDPCQLRSFRYVKPEVVRTSIDSRSIEQIALVINDKHDIHHIHEHGYVESPVRVSVILKSRQPAACSPLINRGLFPKSISLPSTMQIWSIICAGPARRCPTANPSILTSFRSATRPGRRRSLRYCRDTTASTPSPPSTTMPFRPPAAGWIAR